MDKPHYDSEASQRRKPIWQLLKKKKIWKHAQSEWKNFFKKEWECKKKKNNPITTFSIAICIPTKVHTANVIDRWRIWSRFFKIDDNSTLNFLYKRFYCCIQHFLAVHSIWTTCTDGGTSLFICQDFLVDQNM